MILVDTCVWIDHLHHGEERLSAWLRADLVGCHPAVVVLGAALLQPGARLWTRDKRLRRAATDAGAPLVAD